MSDDGPDDATRRIDGAGVLHRTLRLREGHLVVLQGPDRGRRFAFRPPAVVLGKSSSCDIVLTDDAVSKLHLSIDDTPEGFLLRDLGSTNGVFVDQVRVREGFLSPGATIRLGETTMRFEPPGEQVLVPSSTADRFGPLRGASPKMREIFGILERVAPTDTTVLISGETGTGKEVVAQAIHEMSPRQGHPFVVFDCSAVSREQVESQLFGHHEGAFTGASSRRKGAFLTADGGTVFIDEMGELPIDLQPKLLRVLEKREVQALGSDRPQKVDVRVVAATHRDLREMVRAGSFRQDLYYRLSVIELQVPPLRERPDDLPLLTDHFLDRAGRSGVGMHPDAMAAMAGHPWEGNVRELKNVIERALVFAGSGPILTGHLMLARVAAQVLPEAGVEPVPGQDLLSGERTLDEIEAEVITATLKRCSWNKSQAARTLGINRSTLLEKVTRYGIKP